MPSLHLLTFLMFFTFLYIDNFSFYPQVWGSLTLAPTSRLVSALLFINHSRLVEYSWYIMPVKYILDCTVGLVLRSSSLAKWLGERIRDRVRVGLGTGNGLSLFFFVFFLP